MNFLRGLTVAAAASTLVCSLVVAKPAFAQASGSVPESGIALEAAPAQVTNPASTTKAEKRAARKEARKEARAKRNAELKALEQNGYRPGDTSPNFPENALKAQGKTDVPMNGQ
jgi:hypothetical protein